MRHLTGTRLPLARYRAHVETRLALRAELI